MAEAFVVMQIGNPELDRVYADVICAALRGAGLEPRRVDKHNEGDLLKSEIIQFIERSEIIVADLTNARPNCYLEIGYAMGLGKKKNLILTCRDDHFPRNSKYTPGGPRVHFDLEGYDILSWSPDDDESFRTDLERRIRRRRAILSPAAITPTAPGAYQPTVDDEWLGNNRSAAEKGLDSAKLPGFWETVAAIAPQGDWSQQELRRAVNASTIDTFGWPIGLSFSEVNERPRPTAGGIVTEITAGPLGKDPLPSYDYWNVQKNGDFYYLRGFFEDSRGHTDKLFFNTRIVQVTEMLLFLARLYGSQLQVTEATTISIAITLGGLKERLLEAIGGRWVIRRQQCHEHSIETKIVTTIGSLESHLSEHVKELLAPVFMLFDFAEFGNATYTDIVDRFVAGEIT